MRKSFSLLLLLAWMAPAQLHKVPVSDSWYPADAAALRQVLDNSFAAAERRTDSAPPRQKLLALLAPHAALSYSGTVAAAAYRRLDNPPNVIVLGFSHRRRVQGVVAPDVESYSTPLGEIRVNRDALRELGFPIVAEARVCDHSLENQLPFVQRAAPKSGLIPLYVGELNAQELDAAARKLAARLKQGDVIVASSDLTHYGQAYKYTPFPRDDRLPNRLRDRAVEIMERVGSLDVADLDSFLRDTNENVCGWLPIRLMMATLRLWDEDVYPAQIDYMASGELTRDYSLSVGYAAMGFYPMSAFAVGEDAQKRLLASARQTLDGYLANGKRTAIASIPAQERGPELEQRSGVFVTVKKNGRMRGCIGTLGPSGPLGVAVADRTLAAAQDPRFPPLTAREAPLSLEISLLTPLKRITDWRQFRIGQGGLIVLDGRSGTILPQIAEEMHWTRPEQFLQNLSEKAGLDASAYRDPRAVLYVYDAHVFAEPEAAAAGRTARD